MRILIAGILGAIVMFVWVSIAHMATPLANMGFSQIPNEASVLAPIQAAIGNKPGLYFFPWVDPKDPKMMEKHIALEKTNPSGLLIYHPAGHAIAMTHATLIAEFAKELIETLLAAWIVSLVSAAYLGRVGVVVAIGVIATLSTNASYHIWYGFPLDYTVAAFIIDIVGFFVAGLVIAWWIGRARVIRTS